MTVKDRLSAHVPPVEFHRHSSTSLDASTTHLIVEDAQKLRRTEKLLMALARGNVWILPVAWLRDSLR